MTELRPDEFPTNLQYQVGWKNRTLMSNWHVPQGANFDPQTGVINLATLRILEILFILKGGWENGANFYTCYNFLTPIKN